MESLSTTQFIMDDTIEDQIPNERAWEDTIAKIAEMHAHLMKDVGM